MKKDGKRAVLSGLTSCPTFFPRTLWYWGKGSSPGMSPPSREGLGEGPELSVTFSSPTFLGPAGSETLQLILSPAPSPKVGTYSSSFPPSHLIARAAHASQQWEGRHPRMLVCRRVEDAPEGCSACLEAVEAGRQDRVLEGRHGMSRVQEEAFPGRLLQYKFDFSIHVLKR